MLALSDITTSSLGSSLGGGYVFPVLPVTEILTCLDELGISAQKNELEEPMRHKERLKQIFLALVRASLPVCGCSRRMLLFPSFVRGLPLHCSRAHRRSSTLFLPPDRDVLRQNRRRYGRPPCPCLRPGALRHCQYRQRQPQRRRRRRRRLVVPGGRRWRLARCLSLWRHSIFPSIDAIVLRGRMRLCVARFVAPYPDPVARTTQCHYQFGQIPRRTIASIRATQ